MTDLYLVVSICGGCLLLGMGITLLMVFVGFRMGQETIVDGNRAGGAKRFDPGPATDDEGDYFGDELPDYESDPNMRISTV